MNADPKYSPKYSLVIPIYNEEGNLPELRTRLDRLLDQLDGPTEVILVDDGSRDRSFARMLEIHAADPRYKLLRLSRNFGHQIAITAGMEHAAGAATVILDADLQDPPEVILEMAEKWKQGFEVVYGVRTERESEGWFKRTSAAAFYRILNRLTDVEIPQDVGDFRLVDRRALDAFLRLRERSRYVRGMFSWIGFRQIGVTYSRKGRFAGHTHYPLRKMLRLAFDGIIGFSSAPLKLALNLGFLVSSISFLIALWAIFLKLTGRYTVTGWSSLAVVLSFLGGVQLIVSGILGEYIGRIHDEVKGRPIYLLGDARGFEIERILAAGERR